MSENNGPVKVPILLVGYGFMDAAGRRLEPLGRLLRPFHPALARELPSLGIMINPDHYRVGSFFSALIYAVLCSILIFAALTTSSTMDNSIRLRYTAAMGFVFFLMFLMLHLIYPSILVKKIAALSENDLLFALREIMLSINSGIPLFDSMKNVSLGNYGKISQDFEGVVKQVESGMPEREALKQLAISTESEYMKRAIWYMTTALETGASMSTALPGIVETLESHTYRNIRSYSSTLNFLMLIYMLIAAAIPSLGITFLILLSAFSGLGVTMSSILILVVVAAIGQLILIGYMAQTRPEIFGG
jgi:flagellar protein FlaJ